MADQATILQFGTGKFLRCFTDLFVHQMNQTDTPVGRIAVVQSTGSERAEFFNRRAGQYRVAIRGLKNGQPVDQTVEVQSVSRAIAAADAWHQVIELARSDSLKAIVSNTTEAGYQLDSADTPHDAPPRSFPAKLLCVLKARFEAGLPGTTILPCELLERNGAQLFDLLIEQAQRWGISSETRFRLWLEAECLFAHTLVDRIVSAPGPDDPTEAEEPLFAVCEPFALWLIQGKTDVPALLEHPAVRQVEDLEPYHLRKVRILNGAHTALVAKARPMGIQTVRQAVEDQRIRPWLESLLFDEIVPTLEGRTAGADQFAQDVLERFANPYLEHQLADIALHHAVKLQTRLAPTLEEHRQRFGRTPRLLAEVLS